VNVEFSSLPPMSVAEKRASHDRFVHRYSKFLCISLIWLACTVDCVR
jgi:hypothetical protein